MKKLPMDYGSMMLRLKDYTGEDEVVTSADIASMVREAESASYKLKTGFPTLDRENIMDGVEGGELIVISGPRKSGKTLFAQSVTNNLYKYEEVNSLWFSFELPVPQFVKRFGEPVPTFVLPKKLKAYAQDWLQERIIEAIAKYGVPCVFIDHLHFLFDMARVKNTSLEIGTIIRWLKRLAIDLNIVIWLMCHTNKVNWDKEDMTDESIRDSSFVAQESDVALMIWRVKGGGTKARAKLCFSRRTGALDETISLHKKGNYLVELAN